MLKHLLMSHKSIIATSVFALLIGMKAERVNAQDSIHTVFHLPKVKQVGIYIAPEFHYGMLQNTFTTFNGFGGGLVFNQKFSLGIAGQRSNQRDFSPSGVAPLTMHAGYMGIKMEYTVKPTSKFHVSFPLLIGGSQVRLDSARPSINTIDTTRGFRFRGPVSSDGFLLIQPGVMVEANLFRYMKVFAGVNYRYNIAVMPTTSISSTSMNGLSVSAGLKLGLFDVRWPFWRKQKS